MDLSSRPEPGQPPRPLDFQAGVYGVVVKAGDGPWGTITVQIQDSSLVQYLHTSASRVKVGDLVVPDTKLGVTGRTGEMRHVREAGAVAKAPGGGSTTVRKRDAWRGGPRLEAVGMGRREGGRRAG